MPPVDASAKTAAPTITTPNTDATPVHAPLPLRPAERSSPPAAPVTPPYSVFWITEAIYSAACSARSLVTVCVPNSSSTAWGERS